ncbi:hypothetical protein KPL71_014645 [Citrus sinensis]|uniref:Uncharacterized protein n=1 Tax=Citrus sinensis TaxID=2711 RepID=A0ACB8KD93_CITSI|nr:hypothetical protein KPL71_014645 [Citrus sinensis]
MPEEAEQFCFTFVLYLVRRLSNDNEESLWQGTNDNEFNLCHILRVMKPNLVDFSKELPQFLVKFGPMLSNTYGADWQTRLEVKEFQANFVHFSISSN